MASETDSDDDTSAPIELPMGEEKPPPKPQPLLKRPPDEEQPGTAEATTNSATASAAQIEAEPEITPPADPSESQQLVQRTMPIPEASEPSTGDSQTYNEFRASLGLPPSSGPAMPIHLNNTEPASEADKLAAVYGGVLMKFSTDPELRASLESMCGSLSEATAEEAPSPERSGGTVKADDGDDDLDDLDDDGVVGITLEPGGSRDITKSPKHHQLKMDNFVEAADDDDDDASDLEGGEWVDVGGESTGPSPTPQQYQQQPREQPPASPPPPLPSADVGAARAARRPQVDPFQPQILQPSPRLLQKQQEKRPPTPPPPGFDPLFKPASAPEKGAKEVEGDKDDDKDAAAGAADAEDEVAPFELDPTFDYDSIKHTPRFSVARALVEGEYYDRLCEESVSSPAKGKGPPLPHLM